MPANIQQSRVSDIAAQIRGACSAILDTQEGIITQQDALNATRDDNRSVRLQAMVAVADMSASGKWFPGEITAACKHAAESGNRQDKAAKSLATFISEMKNCADPKVRDQFKALVSAVETAWADEAQAVKMDENAPTPLRKCWARAYHAVSSMARHIKEHGGTYTTAQAIVQFAEDHDPAFDVKRVHKRMQSLVTELQAMFREFPHDEIKTAADFLELVKPEDLVKAREAFVTSTATAGVLVTKQAPVTTVEITSATTADEAIDEVEPSEGAIDLLDDVLNEVAGGMALAA
jgi:hypothetical protein